MGAPWFSSFWFVFFSPNFSCPRPPFNFQAPLGSRGSAGSTFSNGGCPGAGEGRPYASGSRDCARLGGEGRVVPASAQWGTDTWEDLLSIGIWTPKGGLEHPASPVSFNMRSILCAIRLGFHKVTGFLVASDVLEPNPCDFAARDVWYPTPTFTGESTLCFSHSSFSPPLGLSRFISL